MKDLILAKHLIVILQDVTPGPAIGGGHEERRGRQFITASAVGTYSGGEFKRLLQADAFVGTFGDGVGIGRRGARTREK